MVVNTVMWFDAPVDQASVLEMFGERVVARFRRFRQRAADPALTLAPWAAPEWAGDAGFAHFCGLASGRSLALADASFPPGRGLRRSNFAPSPTSAFWPARPATNAALSPFPVVGEWIPTGFVDTIRSGTMVYEERTGSGTGSQEVHPGI